MNEEAAFLRAICEQPDEDTPRLAFADYLDEQGGEVNVAWAELIRVQIELARGARGERAQHLARRDRELEPLVALDFQKRIGLPGHGHWEAWARGFPLVLRDYTLAPDEGDFECVPPIPLSKAEMSDARDDELIAFLEWPGLQFVRELDAWSNPWFTRGALALANCRYLTNLERLRIATVALTDEIATAFLESPYLSRLSSAWIGRGGPYGFSDNIRQRLRDRFGPDVLT